jgi:conjugal transfer pilus assembly protein TraL
MKPLLMPRNLDDPMMVFLWSADEVLPGMAVFIVGVLISQKLVSLALALIAVRLMRRMKEGFADGYLLHTLYWWGLLWGRARTLPNPFIRECLP